MPTCFVPGCKNKDKLRKPNISYHMIPKRLKVEWLQAIGRDPTTFIIQQRICSDHFLFEDYERIGVLRKLKWNVIPSVKLPELPKPTTTSQPTPLQLIHVRSVIRVQEKDEAADEV